MTKLCIVDLDGVIADNAARFQKAVEAKQSYIDRLESISGSQASSDLKSQINSLYWKTAFNPELVALDTLIDGVKEALETLRFQKYYELLFVTSRPVAIRDATVQWLYKHNILFYISNASLSNIALIMKEPAFQYVKTVTWKAGIIQTLASLYGATDLLVVEDEQANIDAIQSEWQNKSVSLRICSSLAEAIAEPVGDETESPF